MTVSIRLKVISLPNWFFRFNSDLIRVTKCRFILAVLSTYYWEQDDALKAKLKGPAFEKLPFYLDKLEAQVKNNGGYFVRGKVNDYQRLPNRLFHRQAN